MLDNRLRPLCQQLLIDPILSLDWIKQQSPLLATALSSLFGIAVAPLLAFKMGFLAIVSLLISGYFDLLDGSLARLQKSSSPQGAVLDITSDRLVEFCVILGLFFVDPEERALPAILMLGSVLLCITSFLVVGIFSQNTSEKSFHYSPGLVERLEAFCFWIAMILFPSAFSLLAYTFTALILLTTALRLKEFLKKATQTLS